MSFPFTPEQIASFSSALKDIAEAIDRGEKAKKDAKFVSFVRSFDESEAISEKAKSNQDGHHEPKEGFSFFQWLGKKKKIEAPATIGAATTVITASVSATKPASAIPSLFDFHSSDVRIAGRFIAELPWNGLGSNNEIRAGDVPNAPARPEVKIQTEIATISGYDRIVNQFFSELPWSTNRAEPIDNPVSAMEGSALKPDISRALFPPSAEKTIEELSYRNTSPANPFFSDLPWQKNSENKDSISIYADIEPIPEITVTADLTEAKVGIYHDSFQRKDKTANAFFSRLPWVNNTNNQEAGNKIPATLEIHSELSQDDSLDLSTETMRIYKVESGGDTAVSAQQFFSNTPWLFANVSTGIASVPDIAARQDLQIILPADENLARAGIPFGSFFQALPWKGSIKADQSFEHFRSEASNDSEAVGIFSLATQSAIRASQKTQVIHVPKLQNKTDSYFKKLPWERVTAK